MGNRQSCNGTGYGGNGSDTRGVRLNLTVYCSGREETRSETEILCSHNLQSGHLA